ncbi:hypothetical protein Chor_012903 [Crotalus horridus]
MSLSYPSAETRLPCEFCEELYPEEDLILHQFEENALLLSLPRSSDGLQPSKCLGLLQQEEQPGPADRLSQQPVGRAARQSFEGQRRDLPFPAWHPGQPPAPLRVLWSPAGGRDPVPPPGTDSHEAPWLRDWGRGVTGFPKGAVTGSPSPQPRTSVICAQQPPPQAEERLRSRRLQLWKALWEPSLRISPEDASGTKRVVVLSKGVSPSSSSSSSSKLGKWAGRAIWCELSSQYLEQLKQKKPCPPAHGSHSQVPARRIQLAAPNNRREDPAALSKGRKPRNLGDGEGRTPPGRGPSDPVATPLPARYSSPDFLPSSYIPSFPTAVPTRPSIRQEGGQSPAGPPHFNNSKVRAALGRWPLGQAVYLKVPFSVGRLKLFLSESRGEEIQGLVSGNPPQPSEGFEGLLSCLQVSQGQETRESLSFPETSDSGPASPLPEQSLWLSSLQARPRQVKSADPDSE